MDQKEASVQSRQRHGMLLVHAGTDAETSSHQCSDSATTTMDMATRIFFHILPANSRFHPSFLPPRSPSASHRQRRAELFHAEGKYSTFYRVLLQSQPVSFLSASYGNDGRWMGHLSIYPSSMVTSNDKRGSSEKTGRLLQF